MTDYIDKLYHKNWLLAWLLELIHLDNLVRRVWVSVSQTSVN